MKNSVGEISLQAKRSYLGISLLPSVYKIYTGSIYTRLIGWIEEKYDFLPETQFGFRKGRSTISAVNDLSYIFVLVRRSVYHFQFFLFSFFFEISFLDIFMSFENQIFWNAAKRDLDKVNEKYEPFKNSLGIYHFQFFFVFFFFWKSIFWTFPYVLKTNFFETQLKGI